MTPRELPAPPDRQSVHYPGFDIFLDTHIPLPRARSASIRSVELVSESKQGCKENLPPRRKAKKAATAPNSSELIKTGLLSPDSKQRDVERMGKSRSTPVTPNRRSLRPREGNITPTPRGYGSGFARDLASPYRTTPASIQNERKMMRRLLEDEADKAGGDDDVADDML